jgi:microcystin-dependent protein
MKTIRLIKRSAFILFCMMGVTTLAQVRVGDNLGSHRATQTIEMVSNSIDSVGALSASPCIISDNTTDLSTIGAADKTVDIYSTFVLQQSTTGMHFYLPDPTVKLAGRTILVINIGTTSFVIKDPNIEANNQTLAPGCSVRFIYNGKKWKSPNATGGIIGEIRTFGGTTPPDGWMLCDGRSLIRSAYPGLFRVISTSFGAVDNTHFNLPDFQGRFLRGADNGVGHDPDATTRVVSNTGGNSGTNVGSLQQDAARIYDNITASVTTTLKTFTINGGTTSKDGAHTHSLTVYSRDAGSTDNGIGRTTTKDGSRGSAWNNGNPIDGGGIFCRNAGGEHAHSFSVDTSLAGSVILTVGKNDKENRPVNVAVNYIIKY